MNRATTYFFKASLVILGLLASQIAVAQESNKKPNFVFIMVDQWRGQAMGFLGIEPVITPNIDALAKESRVFTRTIANYPVCSPSRAMMMSGVLSFKNGVYDNANTVSAPYGVELTHKQICWSDLLKKQGYSNGYIGKWHLDSPYEPYIPTYNNQGRIKWNEWTPKDNRHGFDYWYAYGTYDRHLRPMYWSTDAKRDDFHYVNQWGPEHEVDKAIEFIDKQDKNKPFSVTVSMNPPHSEYDQVPAKYLAMYDSLPMERLENLVGVPPANTPMGKLYRNNIKRYFAAMTGVDEQIGRLMNKLKEENLLENTVILFVADHGNCLGKNYNAEKNSHHEESLRVPGIISWKGHIKPVMDDKTLFSVLDINPTILGLLGIKNEIKPDGTDFSPLLLNGKDMNVPAQFFMGRVRADDKNSGFRGIRTHDYKLSYDKIKDDVKVYLFDVNADPYDQNNMAAARPDLVKKLSKELRAWLKKGNDPFTF